MATARPPKPAPMTTTLGPAFTVFDLTRFGLTRIREPFSRGRVKVHVRLAQVAATAPSAGVSDLDELTLKRAQRGETAACTALVKRYERVVFAVVSRMLVPSGRRAAIEDVAQETFLRVFRALPTWDGGGGAQLSRGM